jgi:hypothetical protein
VNIKLLSVEPVNQQPNYFLVFLINSILLGLALDKTAVERSFENWRIMACKIFMDNDGFGIGLATGINCDKLEGIPGY